MSDFEAGWIVGAVMALAMIAGAICLYMARRYR